MATAKRYRRTGFNCDNLIIANCEFFYSSQTFDSQTYSINSPPLRAICADAIIKIRNVAKKETNAIIKLRNWNRSYGITAQGE